VRHKVHEVREGVDLTDGPTPKPHLVTRAIDACTQRGIWPVLNEVTVDEIAQANATTARERIVIRDG